MENLENFLLKSVSYNMALQMSFRIFSFILNAILFRNVSNELIGACNFRLALLYTTIMYLAKEPFKRSLPKISEVENKWEHFVNSVWLIVPNGILVSIICSFLWAHIFELPNAELVSNYKLSVYLCCISCVVELIGEVASCLAQLFFMAKTKVAIEASSLFMFNIIFVFLAIYFPSTSAMSYSIARLVNSIIYVVSNFYFLLNNNESNSVKINFKKLLPQIGFNVEFDYNYLKLVKAYYMQSLFKQILTEGERYLITVFNLLTFSESGVYDVINNLGSLIARFIFLPIEDGSYIFFTNSLKRGIIFKEQTNSNEEYKAKNYFEFFLKLVSLIGVLVLFFGQSYSKLLLQIYGGDKLGRDDVCVNMLRFYCVYVYLLALNGITESFFNATMSDNQLEKHNYKLVVFSGVFLFFTFYSVKLVGIYGFLLGNCFNMLFRIVYSSFYIRTFFTNFNYDNNDTKLNHVYNIEKGLFPNLIILGVLVSTLILTKMSEYFLHPLLHFGLGALLFLVNLFVIYLKEKKFISYAINLVRKSKTKSF